MAQAAGTWQITAPIKYIFTPTSTRVKSFYYYVVKRVLFAGFSDKKQQQSTADL